MVQFEALFAKKDEKLKYVATELKRTQKMLRLLHNGISILDHMITTSKSFDDHSGVGYRGESSGTKIVFLNPVFLLILLVSHIISM